MRQDCFPRVKKTTYNWVKLICIVCVCVCVPVRGPLWRTPSDRVYWAGWRRWWRLRPPPGWGWEQQRWTTCPEPETTQTQTQTQIRDRRHTDWTSVLWGYFFVLLDRSLTLILTNDCVIRFQASFYIFIIISLSCIVTNTILWHKVTNHWLHFWHLIMISVI